MATKYSVTNTLTKYLESSAISEIVPATVRESLHSVMQIALSEGMSLREYVYKNPVTALRQAESCYATWQGFCKDVVMHGGIKNGNEVYAATREITKMINLMLDQSRKDLEKVNEILAHAPETEDTKKRDQIVKVMFEKAISKGDTKALTYLVDRIDGRPAETRVADIDYDNAYNVYAIVHSLFEKQTEVLNSGSGTRLICTSRRAGKSTLLGAIALIESLYKPNTRSIIIGETLEQTEIIYNGVFNQMIYDLDLKDSRGRRLDWKHLENNSQILIRGLSNTKDPDQIRGHKAKVIVIDEFFHLQGNLLEYLQREVLRPMQMDYADDYKFICAGTPPPVKGTYGEKAWKEWDVPHFMWTYKDNPHPLDVDDRERFVQNMLDEQGLTWDMPFVRREYGGEWIYDDDLLLYPDFHTYEPPVVPQFHIDMVLFGIDYGVSDSDALVGIAWDTVARRGYVFHEDKFSRLDIHDRTISQLQFLRQQVLVAWDEALQFFPGMDAREANKRIIWVADDNDQHISDDFNINCRNPADPLLRLNIMTAHKTDKVFMHDKIRDLLRTGGLLLPVDGHSARECISTVLKRGVNGQVYPEIDDKAYHPDILHAIRYALWNVIGQENEHKR